jgi:hypothetical protein
MTERLMSKGNSRNFGLTEWINFFLGVWLILSPFVLRYSGIRTAVTAETILGIIVVCLSLYIGLRHAFAQALSTQVGGSDAPISWFLVPTGILIILAPFMLGYASSIGNLIVNEILIGAIVAVTSGLVSINDTITFEAGEHGPKAA